MAVSATLAGQLPSCKVGKVLFLEYDDENRMHSTTIQHVAGQLCANTSKTRPDRPQYDKFIKLDGFTMATGLRLVLLASSDHVIRKPHGFLLN